MKQHISTCLNPLEKENVPDDKVRQEYLKHETKTFSKILRLERVLLEKNTKSFESDMKNYKKYNDCKAQSKEIYKIKV